MVGCGMRVWRGGVESGVRSGCVVVRVGMEGRWNGGAWGFGVGEGRRASAALYVHAQGEGFAGLERG